MGLTIHYRGCFKKEASLKEMIEEVEDISKIYNWDYHIFENAFPKNSFDESTHDGKLYGICFTPPGSETVCLSFLSNGKMSGPVQLQLYGNSKNKKEQAFLYHLFVKTQFAGSEIHMLLIHLLKYLNTKYFSNFKVDDEGHYWETENKELLRDTFKQYTGLLNSFSSLLEHIPQTEGESLESFLERLAKLVQDKNKK